MIQRVWEQVQQVHGASAIIATEDERIAAHVEGFNGKVMLTSAMHQSGTDRCAEVLSVIDEDFDIIVNVQGDEPFIKPEQLLELTSCFHHEKVQIATLIKEVPYKDEYLNPDTVKCVINNNNEALYFSRFPIPFKRNPLAVISGERYYKHIGLYAYRPNILREITKLPVSMLEACESLEQLRWLEHGYHIQAAITKYDTISIDTPEDLERAINFI
jgi:3-deoxy-manno-octulosonate cytidylyltransferase (CMP-KDO synthetase)